MKDRRALTAVTINELAARRWSPRAYDGERPVSHQHITALIEAARWAPSCFGAEPWRFLVWNRADDAAGWQAAFDCLSPSNHKWAHRAPLLMLACAATHFEHNGQPNRWAQYDTGMAALSLSLEAVAQGLVAHQMGGFDIAKVRAAFSIPEDFTPMAMVAVGYQAEADTIADEETRQKELKPRARKPVGERFYRGRWGVAAG
ncbi:MAG: nitroreductase family protein [Betaproteobacteria bacterium]|nr:nitroreductase family protein [Betaproteobacteria bacterium]